MPYSRDVRAVFESGPCIFIFSGSAWEQAVQPLWSRASIMAPARSSKREISACASPKPSPTQLCTVAHCGFCVDIAPSSEELRGGGQFSAYHPWRSRPPPPSSAADYAVQNAGVEASSWLKRYSTLRSFVNYRITLGLISRAQSCCARLCQVPQQRLGCRWLMRTSTPCGAGCRCS